MAKTASRMRREILATARDLRRAGIVSDMTLEKITARDVDQAKMPTRIRAPSPAEIVAMREAEKMSQAVFAQFLNVAVSTLSQWERGEKAPRGAAARLLTVVQRKGVSAII